MNKIITYLPYILALAIILGIISFRAFTAGTTPPELPATVYDSDVDGKTVAALWNAQTGYIEALSLELEEAKKEIQQKDEKFKVAIERLKNEQEEIKRLQKEIENQRKLLNETITVIENNEVKNLRSQATAYSNMDPANIVKVFNTMDDVEVVKLLYFMGADLQSEIFQAMIQAAATETASVPGTGGKITGAAKVAHLNEMLKFTLPPKK